MQVNTVDELISDMRQGRMVVLLDDDADSNNEGVVMVAAEHCDASHVNFMARQARGLVCLTLTEERCRQLDLPPMVDDARGEKSNFTLSIEASEGIDTGISAADRALTVQAAVAPHAGARGYCPARPYFPADSRARWCADPRRPYRSGFRLCPPGGPAAGGGDRRHPDPRGYRWPMARRWRSLPRSTSSKSARLPI